MVAVILPDGGRGYLSKIFNDEWMTQYGFLERGARPTVGDVLREKTRAGEIPPFVVVQTHQPVRDAITLLHEHRVSQLPVVSRGRSVHGRRLGRRARAAEGRDGRPGGDDARRSRDVMEAPFTGVSTVDPVREAVELLTGDVAGADRVRARPPGGHRHPHRPARVAGRMSRFATKAVHAGPGARPDLRRRRAGDPPVHDLRAERARRVRRGLRLLALGQPDARRALERALGELEGGLGSAFSSGMAAEHALITAVCNAGDHVVIPDDLYGGTYRLVDKVLSRWGLEYTMVDQTDLDAVAAAVRPETKLVWVETPTNPTLKVIDVPGVDRAGRRRVRRGRQHVRDAGLPAAAGARRRRRRALGDEVPRRAFGRRRRARSWCATTSAHDAVRFVQNSIGAVPGPLDCFLVHRGLRTLHLRMAAHTENARVVVGVARGRRGRVPTCAGPGSPGWSRSGIRTRSGSSRARRCSRWPSRWAGWSR